MARPPVSRGSGTASLVVVMLLCDNYENKNQLSSNENVHTPHTLGFPLHESENVLFCVWTFLYERECVRDETEQDYVEANENLIG